MDIFQHTLDLTLKAEALEDSILQALADGDSGKAEHYSLERQQLVESIPFSKLTGELPATLIVSLQRLQIGNDTLMSVTNDIQQEIGEQLSKVQKGIAGSQAYHDISKQN